VPQLPHKLRRRSATSYLDESGALEARHGFRAAWSHDATGLGAAHNAVDWDAHKAYWVRIEAEGPFGLIEPLEYVISIDDLHGSPAEPPGLVVAISRWR
jgi:hypothetical protein